jgi:hypothetical protein
MAAEGTADRVHGGGLPRAPAGFLPVRAGSRHNGAVSAQEVDQCLDALEEPKRATLALLRQVILDVIPEAGSALSYPAGRYCT